MNTARLGGWPRAEGPGGPLLCSSKIWGKPSLLAAPRQFLSHPDGEFREGPGPEHVATLPAVRSNRG